MCTTPISSLKSLCCLERVFPIFQDGRRHGRCNRYGGSGRHMGLNDRQLDRDGSGTGRVLPDQWYPSSESCPNIWLSQNSEPKDLRFIVIVPKKKGNKVGYCPLWDKPVLRYNSTNMGMKWVLWYTQNHTPYITMPHNVVNPRIDPIPVFQKWVV